MKNVSIVTALSTLRGLGYSSIWIFSALYLRTVLGLSIFQDGLIITIGSSLAAAIQVYGGILSDRFGYKRTIIISIAAATMLYLLLVADGSVRASAYLYPIVFIALMISNSAQAPAANAIISESSDVKLKGFSILRVGNNIGWGIGPAIGGFLISVSGFFFLFVFGFAASVAGLILSFSIHDVRARAGPRIMMKTENRLLIILSFVALLLFIVQAQETVTLSNYAKILRNLNYYDLGLIYLTNGIAVILTQGLVYRYSRRIGNYYSFIIGGLLYSFGFFSYAFSSGLAGMIISTVVLTFGEDFAFPAGYAMVSIVSKPENIGKNMGIYNAFISAGRAIGPLLGGYVLSFTSNSLEIWGFTTMAGFLSVAIFTGVFRGDKGVPEQASETALENK